MRWSPAKTDPKILDALTWADVARAYEAGASASSLCRKFGFGTSTFHARAKAGGWQRKQRQVASAMPATETPNMGGVLEGLSLRAGTLEQDAAALAGDGKGADAALKAADRLLRIKRRLGSEPDETGANEALGWLMAMSDGELEAEILRLAGG